MSDHIEVALRDTPSLLPPLRLQWEDVQQAWVLLYPEGMIKLNRSAGEIMRLCDGQRNVGQIITQLEQLFQANDMHKDVLSFLDMARQHRWLAFSSGDIL